MGLLRDPIGVVGPTFQNYCFPNMIVCPLAPTKVKIQLRMRKALTNLTGCMVPFILTSLT